MAAPAAALRRAAPAAAAAASTEPIPRNRPSATITPRRALSGSATPQIPSDVRREICRVEVAGISGHREIAQEVSQLYGVFAEQEAAARMKPLEAAIHIGTVSWRVCSAVLTVGVGAFFGVVQHAMPGWNSEYEEAAIKHSTAVVQEEEKMLEASLTKMLKKKKDMVELRKRWNAKWEEKVAAKEAQLAEWEAKIVQQE